MYHNMYHNIIQQPIPDEAENVLLISVLRLSRIEADRNFNFLNIHLKKNPS